MTQENASVATAPGSKLPSVMRYDRVQAILDSDPALKPFLGPKDQEVIKRNGEKHRYNRGVVTVTNALHERGFDAHNTNKNVVLSLAFDILRDKAPKAAMPEKPKVEKPKVEKPKPEPKAEPAPKPKAPKIPKAPKAPSVPKKPEPKAPAPEPVAAAPTPAGAVPPTAPAPISKPGFVYYIYGTALSHAVTIYKTLEIGDRMPGAEARLE